MQLRLVRKFHSGSTPSACDRRLIEPEQALLQGCFGGGSPEPDHIACLTALLESIHQAKAWIELSDGAEILRYFTPIKRKGIFHLREFARELAERSTGDAASKPIAPSAGPLDFVRQFAKSAETKHSDKESKRRKHSTSSENKSCERLGGVIRNSLCEAGCMKTPHPGLIQQQKTLAAALGNYELTEGIIAGPYVAVTSSWAEVRQLIDVLESVEPNWPRHSRPYGIIVTQVLEIRKGAVTKITVPGGERKETWTAHGDIQINGRKGTHGPWMGIFTLARDADDRRYYHLLTAYLHSMLETDKFVLIDSNVEREIGLILWAFVAFAMVRGLALSIEKPVHPILNGTAFPDFIISMGERRFGLEVLGSEKADYFREKNRQRDVMVAAGWMVYSVRGYLRYNPKGGASAWFREKQLLADWLRSEFPVSTAPAAEVALG